MDRVLKRAPYDCAMSDARAAALEGRDEAQFDSCLALRWISSRSAYNSRRSVRMRPLLGLGAAFALRVGMGGAPAWGPAAEGTAGLGKVIWSVWNSS